MLRRWCFWVATALLVVALGAAFLTGVAAEYAATLNYEQSPTFRATFGFRVSQVVQAAGPGAIVTVLLHVGHRTAFTLCFSHVVVDLVADDLWAGMRSPDVWQLDGVLTRL